MKQLRWRTENWLDKRRTEWVETHADDWVEIRQTTSKQCQDKDRKKNRDLELEWAESGGKKSD